jgi:hypothetical protein
MGKSSFFDDSLSTEAWAIFFGDKTKAEEKNMKRFFVLSIAWLLLGCTTVTEQQTCVTVDIVYQEVSIDESYELCGPTNLTADLLDLHQSNLGLEITSSSFGDYVSGLRGYNFETLGLSMYWAIYLNGEFAMVGISELLLEEGDVLLFEASSY